MTKEDRVQCIRSALCIVFQHCGFGGLTRRGHPTPVNLVVRKHSSFDVMKIDHDFGGDNGYDHYDEQRAKNCKTGRNEERINR